MHNHGGVNTDPGVHRAFCREDGPVPTAAERDTRLGQDNHRTPASQRFNDATDEAA